MKHQLEPIAQSTELTAQIQRRHLILTRAGIKAIVKEAQHPKLTASGTHFRPAIALRALWRMSNADRIR